MRPAPGSAARFARALSVLAVPAVVLSLYAPSLEAPFVFDDAMTVQLNPTLHRLWPPTQVLAGTRPLLNASYALTQQLGAGAPWGHRLGNMLLHLANALLVYAWLRLTLRLPRFRGRYGGGHWMALAVALLFAVHPLQTEAVTYISGRAEALAALFLLVAMVCAAAALHRDAAAAAAPRTGAALAVVLGTLCKETAAAGPLLLLAYDALASGRPVRRVLREEWPLYAFFAAGAIVLAAALLRRPDYAYTAGPGFAQNPYGISVIEYASTQPGVILRYVRLLLVPLGQSFDYDWPVAGAPADAGVLLPALALATAAAAAWMLRRPAPLYALAIAWFFITLAPTSSVIPIADVIAERRVYLPSVGVFLVLALGVADLARWRTSRGRGARSARLAAAAALLLALAAGGWLTWRRNLVWQDALRLWEDSARTSPANPRVWTNLGARHLERGNLEQARDELEHAAALVRAGRSRQATPRQAAYIETYLAVVYLKRFELDRAAAAYRQAVALGAERYLPLNATLRQVRAALVELGVALP